MKKLLRFLCFLICSNSFAQNPQLLANGWYLQKLEIDQNTFTFPTPGFTSLVNFTATQFSISNNQNCFDTSMFTNTVYSGNDSFTNSPGAPLFPASCTDYGSQLFLQMHLLVYLQDDGFNARNPFSYLINDTGGNLQLVITNGDGNKAFYLDTQLSSKSFSKNTFAIAPNPVKDILTFSGINQYQNASINIYDVFGKRVLNIETIDWNKNSINVSKLESGIYFLKVQQKDGDVMNKKFIKK